MRVGASSSWHSPGVWSLFSGTLALESAQGILGLALWLPSFLGLCLMVAVAGGDVMASRLGKLPGRWKAGRVQLPSYVSPLTSCSSSELGKGLELLYSAQRLQSRHTLYCVADSLTRYWSLSPSCAWNVCLPVWAVRVKVERKLMRNVCCLCQQSARWLSPSTKD